MIMAPLQMFWCLWKGSVGVVTSLPLSASLSAPCLSISVEEQGSSVLGAVLTENKTIPFHRWFIVKFVICHLINVIGLFFHLLVFKGYLWKSAICDVYGLEHLFYGSCEFKQDHLWSIQHKLSVRAEYVCEIKGGYVMLKFEKV